MLLVGLWRAFEVGTLHAYHTMRIEMLVALREISLREISLVGAGALFAFNDALAPFVLPVFVLLSPVVGLRFLLVAVPVFSLGALALLTIASMSASSVPVTLFSMLMSLLEVGAPIIPLALLPRLSAEAAGAAADADVWPAKDGGLATSLLPESAGDRLEGQESIAGSRPQRRGQPPPSQGSSDRLGAAYGTIETLFTLTQITLTMLLGMLRGVNSPQSFAGPISLMTGGFTSAGIVSVLFWTLTPAIGAHTSRSSERRVA